MAMRVRLRAPDEDADAFAASSTATTNASATAWPSTHHRELHALNTAPARRLPPLDVRSPEYIEERLENLKRKPTWRAFLDDYVRDHPDSESDDEDNGRNGSGRNQVLYCLSVCSASHTFVSNCLYVALGKWKMLTSRGDRPSGQAEAQWPSGIPQNDAVVPGDRCVHATAAAALPVSAEQRQLAARMHLSAGADPARDFDARIYSLWRGADLLDDLPRAAHFARERMENQPGSAFERDAAERRGVSSVDLPVGPRALPGTVHAHHDRRGAAAVKRVARVPEPPEMGAATFPAPDIVQIDPSYALVDEELLIALEGKNLKPGGSVAWVAYWGCASTSSVNSCEKQFHGTFDMGVVPATFTSIDHFIPCYRDPPNPLKAQEFKCFEHIRLRVKDKQSIPGWSKAATPAQPQQQGNAGSLKNSDSSTLSASAEQRIDLQAYSSGEESKKEKAQRTSSKKQQKNKRKDNVKTTTVGVGFDGEIAQQ